MSERGIPPLNTQKRIRRYAKATVRPQDKVLNFDYFFFISLLSVLFFLDERRVLVYPPAVSFYFQLAMTNRPGANFSNYLLTFGGKYAIL